MNSFPPILNSEVAGLLVLSYLTADIRWALRATCRVWKRLMESMEMEKLAFVECMELADGQPFLGTELVDLYWLRAKQRQLLCDGVIFSWHQLATRLRNKLSKATLHAAELDHLLGPTYTAHRKINLLQTCSKWQLQAQDAYSLMETEPVSIENVIRNYRPSAVVEDFLKNCHRRNGLGKENRHCYWLLPFVIRAALTDPEVCDRVFDVTDRKLNPIVFLLSAQTACPGNKCWDLPNAREIEDCEIDFKRLFLQNMWVLTLKPAEFWTHIGLLQEHTLEDLLFWETRTQHSITFRTLQQLVLPVLRHFELHQLYPLDPLSIGD
eukprot:Protomagalhaensia_wolfi_Nauph_80__398@NODE_121_length_3581_cov_91_036702_g93_i0_p2_GENE_NODE_121_length_3581_cov_91_036702_g93_i0NODE_121_length_3581_cov_91_036702_g93_i0_p2_ORF_typecomplete_len323_score34_68Fboxlike/PF12937_7/3_2Fboxlike/PF12937_7/2e02Fboxlike/PF12937_7/7_8e03_NODE_121_length_3581_cov_91_036702_g93_i01969